jgi:hypothetical protein
VARLLELRDQVAGRAPLDSEEAAERLIQGALRAVNDYFRERLVALPEIAAYLDDIAARAP